jgi:pimeloyl-ACP methyl ester carboxylesterase
VAPSVRAGPLPAWVVLHGITRLGRAHEQLVRFTRALVTTGAVAIVPEVPEWLDFSLAPHLAVPTISAAIVGLRDSGWARDAPIGLIGFSFGAPHAISATAHADLREAVAGSVAFGGYCSLERTIRFLMTGAHDWRGHRHEQTPDPYGRWIVAANYLTAVPEHAGASDVSHALRKLAEWAGDTGIPSLDARVEPRRAELRAQVAEERRALFDLFAPASGRPPDPRRGPEMAAALAAAALRTDPEIEPLQALSSVALPVHVLHGRHDRLIPYSEGLRLKEALPRGTRSTATITRLFGHSGEGARPSPLRAVRELALFFGALRRVLGLV